jgi:hypothetical protein
MRFKEMAALSQGYPFIYLLFEFVSLFSNKKPQSFRASEVSLHMNSKYI